VLLHLGERLVLFLLDGRAETRHFGGGLGATRPECARILQEADQASDEHDNQDDPEDGELPLPHRGFSASTIRICSCAPSPAAAPPPGCLISQLLSWYRPETAGAFRSPPMNCAISSRGGCRVRGGVKAWVAGPPAPAPPACPCGCGCPGCPGAAPPATAAGPPDSTFWSLRVGGICWRKALRTSAHRTCRLASTLSAW